MTIKKILIIGGSYFAGRSFIELLINRKDIKIFVFNRGNIPLDIKNITEFRGDRTDKESIKNNIPPMDWDVVVDFCAYTESDIENILNNLHGTIKHYIFISSTSVYEDSSILPFSEGSKTIESRQPELGEYAEYGLDKIKAEKMLEQKCSKNHISWTILRPSMIYGKFNYAPREEYYFDLVEQNKPIIIPENNLALFTFIFVKDLAKIIIQCIGNPSTYNQIFNTVSDEYISYQKFVDTLEEITKKKLKILTISNSQIIQKKIPLPFPIDQHQIYSGSKLAELFDVKFTPLLYGLKKTYEFYQYKIKKNKGE